MKNLILVTIAFIVTTAFLFSADTEKQIVAQYSDLDGNVYVRYEGETFWKLKETENINVNKMMINELEPSINTHLTEGKVLIEMYNHKGMLANRKPTDEEFEILAEDVELNTLNLYPNPTTNSLQVSFVLLEPGEVELSIFEYDGSNVEVLEKSHFNEGSHSINVDISKFPKREYLISFKTHNKKIVKMVLFDQ